VPTEAGAGAIDGDQPDALDSPIEPITTQRLELASMSIPFMRALVEGDLAAAEAAIGAEVSAWLPGQLEHFLQYRLAQLAVDPSIRQWLGRAMILTDRSGRRRVVGTIGFHGPPDDARRLEVGYSVDPEYRRRGFAREAVQAMFDWAVATHGIRRFIASISPSNEPSLRLAGGFGFTQTGSHIDDIDGLEYLFETDWPPPIAEATA
jgi:RimJ/RimL family protein N-acetyltransferase